MFGASKFKIYSERERITASDRDAANANCTKRSLPVKKDAQKTNVNDPKQKSRLSQPLGKVKVERRALADVSNIQGNSSRNAVRGGPKLADSLKAGRTSSFASKRSLAANSKTDGSHGLSSIQVSEKTLCTKSTIASSKFQRYKAQSNVVSNDSTRPAARNSNAITRKSFPVLKKASQFPVSKEKKNAEVSDKPRGIRGFPVTSRAGGTSVYAQRKSLPVLKKTSQFALSNVKENPEASDKARGIRGFAVMGRAAGVSVYQGSSAKNGVRKDRASDGFILMASRNQSNVATRGRFRKSTKPIIKTTLAASNAKSAKTSCAIGMKKNLPVNSFKGKAELSESSVSADTKSTASHHKNNNQVNPAECSEKLPPRVLDLPVQKKLHRRRSYTSELISGSKLKEDRYEVPKQKLPSIDDQGNPLEVAEYVDEIYQYYWVTESQSPSLANYMQIQSEIIPQMRGILINWLMEVHAKFDLMPETLYLTVALLDRYLSLVAIKKNEMQLVGLTSLLIASKYEDFWHPRVEELISISAETYTRSEMLEMEKNVLRKLKFRMNLPTAYVFMLRFLKASQSDAKLEHLAFFLIELCLVEYKALKFRPSLLCASAIYLARCTLGISPTWTPLLGKHARYEETQIRECAEMILSFHRHARVGLLKVTYEKYMKPEYSKVAGIDPVHTIPC